MTAASLRALMSGLIDYAGLFPPAALDLETAFQNFITYRQSPDRWMLGRFICPAAKLPEVARLVESLGGDLPELPLPISAIARPGEDLRGALAHLEEDLNSVTLFNENLDDRARVESLEARAPEEMSDPRELLAGAARRLRAAGLPELQLFWELPRYSSDREIKALVAALSDRNLDASWAQGSPPWGLKLRCGGVEAAAFPSAGALASAVILCRDHRVPFKATAGLHHPVRRLDRSLSVTMHGFFNLFVGALLAAEHGIDRARLIVILEDEAPESFGFDDELR